MAGRCFPFFFTTRRWRPWGGASRWWLHHSLGALERSLAACGSRLLLRRGPAVEVLPALVRETGAAAVYWNRTFLPDLDAVDGAVAAALKGVGVGSRRYGTGLLHTPETLRTRNGRPYQVFTPFWNALRQQQLDLPADAPSRLPAPSAWPRGETLAEWGLLPAKPDWAGGLRESWFPGEASARARLASFLDEDMAAYGAGRDFPAEAGSSRLSPHLAWGELSPRQAWQAAVGRAGAEPFLRELAWREFSYHLLHHFPFLPERPLRGEFAAFPWRDDPASLAVWRQGRTGYPLVDAGMRQLWQTGWMHNRVRMVAASFLVKHLLLPWQAGERWFRDTLVDADPASNAANWQWVAGCGADAAPFFRIFNPVLQGEKFDPAGRYVRRWLPELAALPDEFVHRPWEAPPDVLAKADVLLGDTYPNPLVDHAAARQRALAAFTEMRK
ncbi:MAG: deoxyribodipyrimidine photo-lyase [Sulfuricellaceae bacterium]